MILLYGCDTNITIITVYPPQDLSGSMCIYGRGDCNTLGHSSLISCFSFTPHIEYQDSGLIKVAMYKHHIVSVETAS